MRKVLEVFEGFVDKIDGDVAHVTLKLPGENLWGEYSAKELLAKGIRERRRFTCQTVEVDGEVTIEMVPIPDKEISAEREREIDAELDKLLGDFDSVP